MKRKQGKSKEERTVEISFGKLIKRLRREYNFTQKQLAHKTGFTPQTISSIENYGQNVGIDTIKLFADSFEITLSELFRRLVEE